MCVSPEVLAVIVSPLILTTCVEGRERISPLTFAITVSPDILTFCVTGSDTISPEILEMTVSPLIFTDWPLTSAVASTLISPDASTEIARQSLEEG